MDYRIWFAEYMLSRIVATVRLITDQLDSVKWGTWTWLRLSHHFRLTVMWLHSYASIPPPLEIDAVNSWQWWKSAWNNYDIPTDFINMTEWKRLNCCWLSANMRKTSDKITCERTRRIGTKSRHFSKCMITTVTPGSLVPTNDIHSTHRNNRPVKMWGHGTMTCADYDQIVHLQIWRWIRCIVIIWCQMFWMRE